MNATLEQSVATQKDQLNTLSGLSQTAFGGFEKLVALNMAATKAVLAESCASLQGMAGAKDPQALLALQSGLAQPLAEKTVSYGRHLYDIASGTLAEMSKTFESKAAESQKSMAAFLQNSLKNAPAGAEAVTALFSTAIDASNHAIASAQSAAKQAVQLVESNIHTATPASLKAA